MQQSSSNINQALRDFDQFPDNANIRPQTARTLLGISIATFWRLVRNGQIKTHKLTERTTTVTVKDLRAFMNQKVKG
jgi:predicted site-specific integrase-resolvase